VGSQLSSDCCEFIATKWPTQKQHAVQGVQRKSKYSNAFRKNICQDSHKNTIFFHNYQYPCFFYFATKFRIYMNLHRLHRLHRLLEIHPSYSSNFQHLSTKHSNTVHLAKIHERRMSQSHLMAQFLRLSWWVISAFPHVYIYILYYIISYYIYIYIKILYYIVLYYIILDYII